MSEIKKAEFGYAEKSALFNEVQKALKALNLRARQYGVDEVYNWRETGELYRGAADRGGVLHADRTQGP